MKTLIYEWIEIHDKVATHAKIRQYGAEWHFQCCIGQQPYGHIFATTKAMHVSHLKVRII